MVTTHKDHANMMSAASVTRESRLALAVEAAILCSLVTAIAGPHVTRYSYDSEKRLSAVVLDKQAALYYQYDSSGNRTNQIVAGPSNPKTDYNTNGLYDLWELAFFGSLLADPMADPDHDGVNNLDESRAWTDPTNPESCFHVSSVSQDGSGCTLRWEAQPYVSYRVWWTDDPKSWNITNSVTTASGVFIDTGEATGTRFYRLSVEP